VLQVKEIMVEVPLEVVAVWLVAVAQELLEDMFLVRETLVLEAQGFLYLVLFMLVAVGALTVQVELHHQGVVVGAELAVTTVLVAMAQMVLAVEVAEAEVHPVYLMEVGAALVS
jgi:succinate-acetate transporter protein